MFLTTTLSLQQITSLVVLLLQQLLTTSVAVSVQDTLSLLPCANEHNTIANPCTPLPQHAADAATVNAFSPLPPASEQQPDVLEVLTQQLAEQHIPFCLPSQPLTPVASDPSSGDLAHSSAGHYLLDRYLQDVPACTRPQAFPTQEAKQQASCQGVQHETVTPDMHSAVSQPMTSMHQQHLELRHLEHPGLAPCVPTCTATSAAHSQNQTSSAGLVTHLTPAELCQSPYFACMQELASRALLDNHRCADRSCQSAEVLRLQSSKGQTWKGLALRQAFMGRALRHSDDEASVQDAAGGGGLLNGGAEDGGEGGGPSRCTSCVCTPVLTAYWSTRVLLKTWLRHRQHCATQCLVMYNIVFYGKMFGQQCHAVHVKRHATSMNMLQS